MSHDIQPGEKVLRAQAAQTANKLAELASSVQTGQTGVQGLPSNVQLDEALETISQKLEQVAAHPAMDIEGGRATRDLQGVVEATKRVVDERNVGEKAQTVLREAALAEEEARARMPQLSAGGPSSEAAARMRHHFNALVQNGQPLVRLLATSGEFREMLQHLIELSRYLFTSTTEEAAKKATDQISTDTGDQTSKPTSPLGDQLSQGTQQLGQTVSAKVSGEQPLDPKTKEHLDQMSELSRRMFQKAASNPTFKEGIRHLSELISIVSEQAYYQAATAQRQATDITSEPAVRVHADKASQAAKELFEAFTGDKSTDAFLYHWNALMSKIAHDQSGQARLRESFASMRHIVDYSLNHPEFVSSDDFVKQSQRAYEDCRSALLSWRDDEDYQRCYAEANELLTAVKNDVVLDQWQRSLNKAMDDLMLRGPGGSTELNPRVLEQWQTVLADMLRTQLMFIGLPRFEFHDETYDCIVDNISLASKGLLPANLVISAGHQQALDMRDWLAGPELSHAGPSAGAGLVPSEPVSLHTASKSVIVVRINNVQLDLKDVKFAMVRKSFPKLTDSGTVDIVTSGTGLNIMIALLQLTRRGDSRPHFEVVKTKGGKVAGVEAHIDKLSVHVHDDASHQTLLNFASSIFSGRIKRMAENAIEEKLSGMVHQIVDSLNSYVQSQPASTNWFMGSGGGAQASWIPSLSSLTSSSSPSSPPSSSSSSST